MAINYSHNLNLPGDLAIMLTSGLNKATCKQDFQRYPVGTRKRLEATVSVLETWWKLFYNSNNSYSFILTNLYSEIEKQQYALDALSKLDVIRRSDVARILANEKDWYQTKKRVFTSIYIKMRELLEEGR